MFIFQRLPVMASAWLLVSVALDRRHRICQALKPQLSPRQAVYLVVGSVIMASLASFPFTPLYGDLRMNTAQSEVNGSQCGVTNDLGSSMYRQAENLTLMLNFVLGLIIMVFCYSHIAHRLRKQKNIISLALRPRVPAEDTRNRELKAESEGGKRGDGSILEDHDDRERVVMSTPSSSMATPSNTLEEGTIAEGNVEKREESASRSEVGVWRRGSRRIGSRTTLMMFVLTITGIVTFLPFIVLACISKDEFAHCQQLSGWPMNVCMIALYFPNVNSVVNPFIYSFCHPRFRQKCRQLLFVTSHSQLRGGGD
ncbi:gastrin/cholecystokinin type B receptor-like [Pomacea canaliculata]|uniref:gastrin/cholecystokinin type B receptor-like n=1 Tax=Pomacea canaliculata TaxID=400727 RepID=UPI000D73BA60|nr:gastrin/cholecystokinin type B receptor-like [Pomacea canaliculata]